MPKKQHVHKYRKVKLGKDGKYVVYACSLPDCSHFIPADLVIGKRSICWRCESEFIINEKTGALAKPHCRECTRGTEKVEIPEIDESIFDGLVPNINKASQ